jgi:hypothetical protein
MTGEKKGIPSKDDGKGGKGVFEGEPRKVDCRVTLFLAMTLAERCCYKGREGARTRENA